MDKKATLTALILIVGKLLASPQISFADISDLTNDNLNQFSTGSTYTNNINIMPFTNNNTSFIDNSPSSISTDNSISSLPVFYSESTNTPTTQAIHQNTQSTKPIKNYKNTKTNHIAIQTIPQDIPITIQNNTDNNAPGVNNTMQAPSQNMYLLNSSGDNTDSSINNKNNATVQAMPQNIPNTTTLKNNEDNSGNINPAYLSSQSASAAVNIDSKTEPAPIPNEIKTNLRILRNNYYIAKPLTAKTLSYQQEKKQKINAAPEIITPTIVDDNPRIMIYQPPNNTLTSSQPNANLSADNQNNYSDQSDIQKNIADPALIQPGQNNLASQNIPSNNLNKNIPSQGMPGENTPYDNVQSNSPELSGKAMINKAAKQKEEIYTKKHNNPAVNIIKSIFGMLIKCILTLTALAIMALLLRAFRSSFNGNIS